MTLFYLDCFLKQPIYELCQYNTMTSTLTIPSREKLPSLINIFATKISEMGIRLDVQSTENGVSITFPSHMRQWVTPFLENLLSYCYKQQYSFQQGRAITSGTFNRHEFDTPDDIARMYRKWVHVSV